MPSLEGLTQVLRRLGPDTDVSCLSQKYILQPWWTWLVTLFPLYVAPNTITLLVRPSFDSQAPELMDDSFPGTWMRRR
jgi:hypothetical protein